MIESRIEENGNDTSDELILSFLGCLKNIRDSGEWIFTDDNTMKVGDNIIPIERLKLYIALLKEYSWKYIKRYKPKTSKEYNLMEEINEIFKDINYEV